MLNCWVLSSVWLFSVGAFLHFKQRFSRLSAKLIAPCQHWATWIVFKTRKLTTADHSCPQLDLLLTNENVTLLVSAQIVFKTRKLSASEDSHQSCPQMGLLLTIDSNKSAPSFSSSQSTNTLDNMVVKLWHSYHEQFYTNMFFQNICQIRQHVLIYS